MKTSLRFVALLASLSLLPAMAFATDYVPQPVQPTEPAPTWLPPPPTEIDATTGETVVVQQAPPAGQWVFTSQYGWVWMPHGNSFTFLPANGAAPNMFVFYPAVGWSWVVAPWVWGWGAMPWFGFAGWGGYSWWGSGFGRWNGFARPYAYAGWNGGRYWQGGRWNGVNGGQPAPPRPGGSGAPPRPGYGASSRPGAAMSPGARPGYGAAPSPRASPGAPPRVGSISPGRAYGSPAGYSPGRSYSTPSRSFTSGGQGFAPRSYASAAPRGPSGGGHSSAGFSGAGRGGGFGGGAPAGGFSGGGRGGGGGGGHGGGGRR